MIGLYKCNNKELNTITDFYYKDKLIYNTFNGVRVDRIVLCDYGFLIKNDNINIGFILLVNENNSYNVDMGILRKYRNKGYGSICLKLLKEEFNNFNISVKKDNVAANKAIIKCFKLNKSNNTTNFYK